MVKTLYTPLNQIPENTESSTVPVHWKRMSGRLKLQLFLETLNQDPPALAVNVTTHLPLIHTPLPTRPSNSTVLRILHE